MYGRPLLDCIVVLTPTGRGSSDTGTTDESGRFTIYSSDGNSLIPGPYKVSVTSRAPIGSQPPILDMNSPEDAKMLLNPNQSASSLPLIAEKIPSKYNSVTTLIHEVETKSSYLALDLQSQ